jgi:protein involved in polysaccharide export with SLBB domain
MRNFRNFRQLTTWALFFCIVFALISEPAMAQIYADGGSASNQGSISEAERAAEAQVTLSPEAIIQILSTEPGLMLEVKKMLVRAAFEQGRILEPSDLTDDAVFQLMRDQQSARVIATQQIEDRSYVRALPTREEVARANEWAARYGMWQRPETESTSAPTTETAKSPGGLNQEQAYWATHPNLFGGSAAPAPGWSAAPPSYPSTTTPSTPENTAPVTEQRQLDRASLNQQNGFTMTGSSNNPAANGSETGELLNVNSPAAYAIPNQPGTAASDPRIFPNSPDQATQLAMGQSTSDLNMLPNFGSSSSPEYNLPSQNSQKNQPFSSQPARSLSSEDLNEDRPLIRSEPNPYADVPSLYDLYRQVSTRPPVLERFGMDIFQNGTGNTNNLPMDLPVGPDYVLGPGDGLSIELWGAVSERLHAVVDRQGELTLPEVGSVQVSGRTLGDVQHMVQAILRTQFRDVQADVSLARIRSVRVYVVGDVERPGAYDISSLSTPLNALYAAGGPTSRGSLRHIRQYRGNKLIQDIDAYDLLLHGVHSSMASLESGDTILVPPIGAEVTVEGMVQRPGIYELADENNLAQVLQLAGGVLPSGTLRHIDVERTIAHEKHTMLQLDLPVKNGAEAITQALENFHIQDGDQIRISPILPYADETVYLDGHVFHPGKYPYRKGMKITDLIHSYHDLLPEPSLRHAEIIRLEPPDDQPEVLTFDLADAMANKAADITLNPFDTVRIFGRYDFQDPPQITITGAVRDPGDHLTNGVTHLRDAVFLAGGVTPGADLQDAQVYRKTPNGKLKVLSVNLAKALSGDSADNILLQPKDRVMIPENQQKADPATVQIQGDVIHPGRYLLGEGMTASDLLKLAGGFKRSADTEVAELTTYIGPNGKIIGGQNETIEIAKALAGDEGSDPELHDGDVLTVREQPGWDARGSYVRLEGQVVHPGSYGIRAGERLSSVLERAGGFSPDAYVYGAILQRREIRDIEDQDRADLISRVQEEGAALRMLPETDPNQKMAKGAALLQWQAALEKLQGTPPPGRLVIHISGRIKDWANGPWDIPLQSGDTLTIPRIPHFVMVNGAVYNQTAITFRPGHNVGWYLEQAGGPTNIANKKGIFLIRADGSVVGGNGGLFSGGVRDADVQAGDMIMVPEKALSGTSRYQQVLEASELVSAIGVAVTLARGF